MTEPKTMTAESYNPADATGLEQLRREVSRLEARECAGVGANGQKTL